MSDRWVIEQWTQLMSGVDELLHEARQSASHIQDERVQALLQQAEQQRDAAEAALQAFGGQRQTLLATIDELQGALAVAGRPVRGEVS